MRLATKNIEIGTFIKEQIDPIINTFPIIADKGVQGDFCVYKRTGYRAKNTKDIYDYESTISIEIIIACKTYKDSIRFAQLVKDKLEGWRGTWNDTDITSIFMDNTNEDWSNDLYIQKLYFTINVDDRPKTHK